MSRAADVLVVGAGIVGAACAEALARSGLRVHVLEAERVGGGTTAAGMGHVLVLDDSEAQLALTRLGRALWDEGAAHWPATVERELTGTIWVAADEEELAAARAKHAWYGARSVATEVLDEHALHSQEPHLRPGLAGGLRIPGDSVVYPPRAAQHLLERALAAGARLEERMPVASAGEGHVLLADGRRLEAEHVLVAAGLATPRLVGLAPELVRPKKGQLAITARAPGLVRHQLVELGYLKSAHGHERSSVAFNVQPRATGQLLIGSSRQWDETDARVELAILARMLERARSFVPALASVPVLRTWAGFRPATDDNLPLIGRKPGCRRLWLATGHEGVGITTSLATAALLAAEMRGMQPPIDPTPFRPERLAQAVAHG